MGKEKSRFLVLATMHAPSSREEVAASYIFVVAAEWLGVDARADFSRSLRSWLTLH